MAAVKIGIADLDETKSRMRQAFADREQGAFITFPTVELLWKVSTPKRWELPRAMAGAGPFWPRLAQDQGGERSFRRRSRHHIERRERHR